MHNPYNKQSVFTSTLSKRKRNNAAHYTLYLPYENTLNKKEAANITCDSDSNYFERCYYQGPKPT